MDRDLRAVLKPVEALWSFPDGPLARLRGGELSVEGVDQVVAALERIDLAPGDRELDRMMVALLWSMPLFVEEQKERFLERGGEEKLYQRLRGRVVAEVERLLGLGDVDHDVSKWFGDDVGLA